MLKRRRQLGKTRTASPAKLAFAVTSILFLAAIIVSIIIIDKGINPPLMAIAEEKTTEFATRTINAAVKSTESMTFEDLVSMSMDNSGNVAQLGWNSSIVNRVLRQSTEKAEYFLYGMNKGETLDTDDPELDPIQYGDTPAELADQDPTVVEIPIGQATGSTILANLGPKIPVHFEIVGSIQSDIMYEMREFGINASLFEIYVPVTVNTQIVVPFTTSTKVISTKVFIDSRVIMGDVPEFYNRGGGGEGPTISVPKDRK